MGVALQCFAAFAVSWGCLVMGLLNAWPSYTFDLYKSPNTTLLSAPMTEFEGSLLGSLPSLGAMVGTAYSGVLIDKIGRQKGCVINALPYILAWATVYLTTNSTIILVARFILGIPGGAFTVIGPMFISEVAEDHIRGFLATCPILMYCVGSVGSYLFGWFLSYRANILANLVASVLLAVFCFFVVESPIYLVRQGRDEDARQAISKYRSVSPDSKVALQELSRIKSQVNPAAQIVSDKDDTEPITKDVEKQNTEKEDAETGDTQTQEKIPAYKLLFISPSSRRAFMVVATHLSMQVFMGVVPVMVYAKTLFAHAAPSLSSHLCSVLLGLMLVIGTVLTAVIADKAGRRVLLMTSSTLVFLAMATLGILLQTSFEPAWIAAVVILAFCIFFNIGSGTVPYVLLAESFIPEVQGIASTLLIEWVWFLNFVIIAIFPLATKLLGVHGTFYVFSAVAISNAIIGFLWIPETKGLSNIEIQEAYLKRRK